MVVWSFWIGLIIALVGLIAFGGFAKGKWYRAPHSGVRLPATMPNRSAELEPGAVRPG